MNAAPIVQYFGEQAAAEARRENSREHILEVLELQLHPDIARDFQPALEAIDDLQRLKQLHRAAIRANSVEDFQKVLDANGT